MPPLSPAPKVVAVVCADLHLSHTPPLCRCDEEDWYETQKGYLKQIEFVRSQYDVPFLVPGDVFDRWNAPAELINLALTHFPHRTYGIPGQHDLPNHVWQDIKKSAFWTLVKSGKLRLVEPGHPVLVEGAQPIRLWGFPYGFDPEPLQEGNAFYLEVALVHRYLWADGTGYEGAPESHHLVSLRKKIQGYDAVFVGDNHVPFSSTKRTPIVVNTGSLMRRTIAQIDYEPRLWLYHSDNTVTKHYLDISKDVLRETRTKEEIVIDGKTIDALIEDLKDTKGDIVSFEENVHRLLERGNIEEGVKNYILAAIEVKK